MFLVRPTCAIGLFKTGAVFADDFVVAHCSWAWRDGDEYIFFVFSYQFWNLGIVDGMGIWLYVHWAGLAIRLVSYKGDGEMQRFNIGHVD